MYKKINILLVFILFLKSVHMYSVLVPTTTIALESPLKIGDVITVEGYFVQNAGDASFDIESSNCDWPNNKLRDCIEYDFVLRFGAANVKDRTVETRLLVNGNVKKVIQKVYPQEMKYGDFKYEITVEPYHLQTKFNGYQLLPIQIDEPLHKVDTFRVYGSGIVESYKIERNDSCESYSVKLF